MNDKLRIYHIQREIFICYSAMIVIDETIKILKATLLCDYKCFSGFNRQLTVKILRKNFRLFAS